MNLAFLLQHGPPRKEWLVQGEDVIQAGAAAVMATLLLIIVTRLFGKRMKEGRSYRKWLVLLGCGIVLIVVGWIMFDANPPGVGPVID